MEFSKQEYGVSSHSLLQGIFPTQGSNHGLQHCRQILYRLSHQGKFLSSAHCRYSTIPVLCLPFLVNYGTPPSMPQCWCRSGLEGLTSPASPPFHRLACCLPALLRELCWGQTMRPCSLSMTTTALSKEWGFSVGRDTVPMPSWRTSETRHGEGS